MIIDDKIKQEISENDKKITLILPTESLLIQGLQMAKFGSAQFILKYLKNYENVEFIENFSKDFFEPKGPPQPQKDDHEGHEH